MVSHTTRPVRLLVSARDAAAAHNLVPVIRAASRDERFLPSVLAQQPACTIFQANGIHFQGIEASSASDPASPEARVLLRIARDHLEQIGPDVLLCGLSSPGDGGIDEALLATRTCSAFLMQDFWGEQNVFFGRGADAFFVLDDAAAELSLRRHGRPSFVVGSPRHAAYHDLNPIELKRQVRLRLGIGERRQVIGLFGQSLHAIDGYEQTLRAWATSVSFLGPSTICLYRPHPRESTLDRMRSEQLLRNRGLNLQTPDGLSVEETIVACDAICSIFSNCTYDAAFINRFSSEPVVTPVMLLFEPGMVRLYETVVRLDDVPYGRAGIATIVTDRALLGAELARAMSFGAKRDAWTAAHGGLGLPSCASRLILDQIAESRAEVRAADD